MGIPRAAPSREGLAQHGDQGRVARQEGGTFCPRAPERDVEAAECFAGARDPGDEHNGACGAVLRRVDRALDRLRGAGEVAVIRPCCGKLLYTVLYEKEPRRLDDGRHRTMGGLQLGFGPIKFFERRGMM